AHQAVEEDYVVHRQAGSDHCRLDAGVNRRLTERSPYRALLDHLDPHGKGAGPDQERYVLGPLLGATTRDDGAATGDPHVTGNVDVDTRAGDDLIVEDDRHASARRVERRTGGFGRQFRPGLAAS